MITCSAQKRVYRDQLAGPNGVTGLAVVGFNLAGDFAGKGFVTGTWTGQAASDLAVPVSGIAEAVFARRLSSAAPAYCDGLRSPRLPASIIQGQQDFFGARTYRRIDREGSHHTQWSGGRTEVSV